MQQTFIGGLLQMQAGSAVSSSIEIASSECPADDGIADNAIADDVPEGRGRELERIAAVRWAKSSDWKEDKTRFNTF